MAGEQQNKVQIVIEVEGRKGKQEIAVFQGELRKIDREASQVGSKAASGLAPIGTVVNANTAALKAAEADLRRFRQQAQSVGGGYPEVLEELRTYLVVEMKEMGLGKDAEQVSLAVTERIRTHWGGQQIYIPAGRFSEASKRALELEALFDGKNTKELCRRFGVSQSYLYRLVRSVRAERQRKLRSKLEAKSKHSIRRNQ